MSGTKNESILAEVAQKNLLEPLQGLVTNMVIGFIIVVAIVLYRKHIGKPMKRQSITFLQTIVLVLIFLNFLRQYM